MGFRGDGAALFKSGLDEMNEKRGHKLYANFIPIRNGKISLGG